jgi:hypothetical protein
MGKKQKDINPLLPLPIPESASAPVPYNQLFGQECSNISSQQAVHHRLVAHFRGNQLWHWQVSASASIPARHLSHCDQEGFLLVSPPFAMAEEVLSQLGCCPFTPPKFIVRSVAEPLAVHSIQCIPADSSVDLGGHQLLAGHRSRSVGPHPAQESVGEVLPALVTLPVFLGCWPSIGDLSSTIGGQGVWL